MPGHGILLQSDMPASVRSFKCMHSSLKAGVSSTRAGQSLAAVAKQSASVESLASRWRTGEICFPENLSLLS